jgi:hypothetical protein
MLRRNVGSQDLQLKMEALCSSEMLVHRSSTRCHMPEDGILHSHRCENLKSYVGFLDGEATRWHIWQFLLKMEAIRSSETSVHTRSTQCNIPDDGILHSDHCENLRSYILSSRFDSSASDPNVHALARQEENHTLPPEWLNNLQEALRWLHCGTLCYIYVCSWVCVIIILVNEGSFHGNKCLKWEVHHSF